MPRVSNVLVENNFIKGLITQNTGLNAPENACEETWNCVFDEQGTVSRRQGFEYEAAYVKETIDRDDSVISSYLWKNVSGDGDTTLAVLQVGTTLRFYDISAESVSAGLLGDTVSLLDHDATGATHVGIKECQYADGNGRLFVFHPNCETFYVEYDTDAGTVSSTSITLEIRDTLGEETDPETLISRPTTLDAPHKYNLLNQGWTDDKITTFFGQTFQLWGSFTNGSPTISNVSTNNALTAVLDTLYSVFIPGMAIDDITSGCIPANTNILSIGGRTLTMDANATATVTSEMRLSLAMYPSNSDVWWHFKNETGIRSVAATSLTTYEGFRDTFDVTLVANNTQATRAPQGYYKLNVYDQDRDAASGLSGLTTTSTGFQRASTGAFFAGRVWYSGINYQGFNSKIYFSQILDQSLSNVGHAYQRQDPTSEFLHDLLPNDGGVIDIQDAGTIIKLMQIPGALVVFATNGVWAISGSEGIGFTANDYTIQRISSVPAVTATSFVDVEGTPMWWNLNGIYTVQLQGQQGGGLQVRSLTETTIQEFFDDIPIESKRLARGLFNPFTRIVQWLYRSEEASTIVNKYSFDHILNLNILSNAFYPWSIEGDVKISGMVLVETAGGNLETFDVVDGADNVQDNTGADEVVATQITGGVTQPAFKYIVSIADGSTYDFTFAEAFDDTYADWTIDDETDYDSYLITCPKVHAQGIRKFQTNYITVFSGHTVPSSYNIQGHWDFATNTDTGRWSAIQTITLTSSNYSTRMKRLKIRGHGRSVKLKFSSVSGSPFDIEGWATFETANQGL